MRGACPRRIEGQVSEGQRKKARQRSFPACEEVGVCRLSPAPLMNDAPTLGSGLQPRKPERSLRAIKPGQLIQRIAAKMLKKPQNQDSIFMASENSVQAINPFLQLRLLTVSLSSLSCDFCAFLRLNSPRVIPSLCLIGNAPEPQLTGLGRNWGL
jgi:hypothetical protein